MSLFLVIHLHRSSVPFLELAAFLYGFLQVPAFCHYLWHLNCLLVAEEFLSYFPVSDYWCTTTSNLHIREANLCIDSSWPVLVVFYIKCYIAQVRRFHSHFASILTNYIKFLSHYLMSYFIYNL